MTLIQTGVHTFCWATKFKNITLDINQQDSLIRFNIKKKKTKKPKMFILVPIKSYRYMDFRYMVYLCNDICYRLDAKQEIQQKTL